MQHGQPGEDSIRVHQPDRRGGEIARAGHLVDGVDRVHQLVGNPDRLVAQQIEPFHPQERAILVEQARVFPWKRGHVRHRMRTAQLAVAAVLERQCHELGVIAFDRFHEAGSLGRPDVQALALGDRHRA